MQIKKRIYHAFAKILPKSYRKNFSLLLKYSGEDVTAEFFLGSVTLLALLVFLLITLIPVTIFGFFDKIYFIIGLGSFFLIEIVAYMIIQFKVQDRSKRVEKVLPDALQLISANLKAGMTPFQALRLAARKEFGPLEEEIKRATSKALGIESFSSALLKMSERIKSEMLDRSIKLFTTAMKSGGHLAILLEELAKDIAETNALRRELNTNTKTYMMFIMFTIIIGAPLLLAISIYFVDKITDIQEKTGTTTAGFGMAFLAGKIEITADFLIKVSIAMLLITGLLASMLLGAIREGKLRYGLRYSLQIIFSSLVMFYIFRYWIGMFMGKI